MIDLIRILEDVRRIESEAGPDLALDMLYDQMDALMSQGKFDCISGVFGTLDLKAYSDDLLVGMLTAVLPAFTKIPSYRDFRDRVEAELRRRGTWEEGLLDGLGRSPEGLQRK
jgi:hypothetical protein